MTYYFICVKYKESYFFMTRNNDLCNIHNDFIFKEINLKKAISELYNFRNIIKDCHTISLRKEKGRFDQWLNTSYISKPFIKRVEKEEYQNMILLKEVIG